MLNKIREPAATGDRGDEVNGDKGWQPQDWRPSFASRLFVGFFALLNRFVPWHRLPRYLGLANLAAIRISLRKHNLVHPTPDGGVNPSTTETPTHKGLAQRTIQGDLNDLSCPIMGARRTRFGRNVHLSEAHPEIPSLMMSPNPRLISERLLARDEFKPAKTLNLLAAAWIQFQIHDWFNHGDNEETDPFQIPLKPDDPWHEHPMLIRRTGMQVRDEKGRQSVLPPTYLNTESHWWDASAIYGSDPRIAATLRDEGEDLLHLDDGLLPLGPDAPIPATGFNDNWWIGLEILHTLFVKEHNAICTALKQAYPDLDPIQRFNIARLVNSALIAKIHTVEWTPAILAHPTMELAMRANWWGLAGERYSRAFRSRGNETLFGIPGSQTEHHGVPYSLTEEFVSVYRMHPLMPDAIDFRTLNGRHVKRLQMGEAIEDKVRGLVENGGAGVFGEPLGLEDIFYSFGVSHPGALTLRNFPQFLREHTLPEGIKIDLAAIDIMRDRERGVPRYNRMRRLLRMPPARSFEDITQNRDWAREMRIVYDHEIERVDLQVGMLAEDLIEGFGFSETALRIFILMASRRLKSDRFLTTDYGPRLYTQVGMDWIADNDMTSVLLRHYPQLRPILMRCENAFKPWAPLPNA